MAFNVLGNWRFAVANKGLRSKTSSRKMWRRKTAQRRLRRLQFFGARTAERRWAVTVCYMLFVFSCNFQCYYVSIHIYIRIIRYLIQNLFCIGSLNSHVTIVMSKYSWSCSAVISVEVITDPRIHENCSESTILGWSRNVLLLSPIKWSGQPVLIQIQIPILCCPSVSTDGTSVSWKISRLGLSPLCIVPRQLRMGNPFVLRVCPLNSAITVSFMLKISPFNLYSIWKGNSPYRITGNRKSCQLTTATMSK